jgi:formamidopyrimidine-DNA glycosylase
VVGVGNIYASEALFLANIHPLKKASKVSLATCHLLVECIRNVLSQAIAAGGSSISDFKQTSGEGGYFQTQHQVYDRENQPCLICHTPIRRAVVAGRSTFWCPLCQKK